MQIAPPLDVPSLYESLSPVVFDPSHSHHVNEFASLNVSFCLPGVNFPSDVPSHTTFFVRQHPTNEVFEAVKEVKGLLREGIIPPSYASQTDENEQLLIKHEVWVDVVDEDEHASFAVEMLKNNRWESEIRGMEGDERNGADEMQKDEKWEEQIETKQFSEISPSTAFEEKSGGNICSVEVKVEVEDDLREMLVNNPQLPQKSKGGISLSTPITHPLNSTKLSSDALSTLSPPISLNLNKFSFIDELTRIRHPSTPLPPHTPSFPHIFHSSQKPDF